LGVADILTIDAGANAENVEIQSVDGDTVTVARNYGGANASHAVGAPVVETDYIHLNAQGYEIVAEGVRKGLAALLRE
jgi:lysophospholipase L1-like esterase